jgi:hypothetical protein
MISISGSIISASSPIPNAKSAYSSDIDATSKICAVYVILGFANSPSFFSAIFFNCTASV